MKCAFTCSMFHFQQHELKIMQGGAVTISNILLNHNTKSILSNLKYVVGLLFQNVLSKETLAKSIQNLEYLGRFFTLDIIL